MARAAALARSFLKLVRRSYIVSLTLTVLITATAVTGAILAGWGPLLGLDLRGGVAVVLEPTEPADADTLDQAIEIIRNRVDAIGVAEPDITRQGQNIVVQLPGVDDSQRALELVGQTAELRFRPVIGAFPASDPQALASAKDLVEALNDSADPAESAASGTTVPPASATTVAESTSTTTDGSTSTTVAESTSTTADGSSPTTGPESTSSTVAESTSTTAEGATSTTADQATSTTAAPTTTTTFDVSTAPSVDDVLTDPEAEDASAIVALPSLDGLTVFVLGPTGQTGEIISTASANFQAQWLVNVSFTNEGADLWDDLAGANFGRQLGIALDGVVYSAPTINAREFGGDAVITGSFTEEEAKDLALVLRFGALPIELEPQTVQAVSATLGADALNAGLIAGAIGLVLVAIYMISFYRLLGVVAVLSLVVSGGMLWFIISWLGETQGLAVTLAGATGIVLSIGVAVDSNIVYYERIKEEVRRGRAVRSAAEGSFPAAFSTIVKADTASIIGAAVLFFLTVGAVKGFAFYLGLATVLDLVVSYLFMRPLVVFLTRRFAANNPERLGVTMEATS